MALTRDQILEASDLKTQEVDVPEWGGTVIVRTMTGTARNAFEASIMKTMPDGTRQSDMTNMRAKLIAVTVVGDDGNLLFTPEEADIIAQKSSAALEKVFEAAQALNLMGVKAEAEAAKNSPASPDESSTSV